MHLVVIVITNKIDNSHEDALTLYAEVRAVLAEVAALSLSSPDETVPPSFTFRVWCKFFASPSRAFPQEPSQQRRFLPAL